MVIMGRYRTFLMYCAILLVGSASCATTTEDEVSSKDPAAKIEFASTSIASANEPTTSTMHPELSRVIQKISKWSDNKVEKIMNKIARGELQRKNSLAKNTEPQNTAQRLSMLKMRLDYLRNRTSLSQQQQMPWVDINLTAYFSRLMWETASRIIQKYTNEKRPRGEYASKMLLNPKFNLTDDTAQSMWDEFVSLFDWSEPSPTYATTTTKKLPKWKRRYDYEFPWQRPTFLPGEAPFPPGWEPAESNSAEEVVPTKKEDGPFMRSPYAIKDDSVSNNLESTEPMSSQNDRKAATTPTL